MNDTALLAAKVHKLIETHRAAEAQGIVTKTSVDAGNEAFDIGEKLVQALYPHVGSLPDLLDKAVKHGYVPTLRGKLSGVLADIYDYAQEANGKPFRAHRGDAYITLDTTENAIAATILNPPKRLPKSGDKVLFHRGMYGEWKGTVVNVYVGRGRRLTGQGMGHLFLDIRYSKKKGGSGLYTRVLAKSVKLVDGGKYDL